MLRYITCCYIEVLGILLCCYIEVLRYITLLLYRSPKVYYFVVI